MPDHVYKVIDIVGSSNKSIEDAVQTAIGRASKTISNLRWFEIMQTRGHVEDNQITYQVMVRIGFTLDDTLQD